jgi:hypothetical protein
MNRSILKVDRDPQELLLDVVEGPIEIDDTRMLPHLVGQARHMGNGPAPKQIDVRQVESPTYGDVR